MSDSLGSSGQHAEGIRHISSNTAPPGTTDTSRGTEGGLGTGAESGGVSSSSDIKSPLKPGSGNGSDLQQTNSQGGVIDTVKSYLGYGNNGASETGQLGTAGDTRNAADTTSTTGSTTGSGSGAGITGAAASAASAVGLGSGNSAAGGGLGSTSSSSDAANDTTGTTGLTGSSSSATTGGSTLEAAKEKVQEITNEATKTVTSGTSDHKPPQPAGGKPHKLENESAIPTAGGERLGEKHWGESKIVPDNPEKRASEAGISSEAGQPTQQTSDNTARNTGGATGPPASSNVGSSGNDNGEEKTKITDKIKDKLHIGKDK